MRAPESVHLLQALAQSEGFMRTTFSLSYYCRKSKADRNGLAPIELGITINGCRKFINLPRKCDPKIFGYKHKPKDVEDYLSLMRTRVNEICNEMLANGEPVTTEALREYIRSGGYKSYTIKDLFTDYMRLISKRVDADDLTLRAYDKYKLVEKQFADHIDFTREVTAITPAVIQAFYVMLKAKYQDGTSCGMMTKLKSVIKYAIDNGKLKVNPFQGIKIVKGKSKVEFLTPEEINIIATKDYCCDRLRRVADCFVFQCSTGLSYADLCLLEPDDLKRTDNGYYIQKKRQKTGTTYTSVVLPMGVEIWKKYEGKLPVISNQHTNQFLHEIEIVCGIKKSLHTHLARKSYASGLLRMGVRIEVVSKTLGHTNTRITQAAYADFLNEDIIKEVNAKI